MVELYSAKYVSLHVRETNYAAFHLYRDTLKFGVHGTEAKYYADGENAIDMRKYITREMLGLQPLAAPVGGAAAQAARPPRASGAPAAAREGALEREASSSAESLEEAAAVEKAGSAADIEPGAKDMAKALAVDLD